MKLYSACYHLQIIVDRYCPQDNMLQGATKSYSKEDQGGKEDQGEKYSFKNPTVLGIPYFVINLFLQGFSLCIFYPFQGKFY